MNERDERAPYEQGIEAANMGQHAANCPYQYDTEEGEQWMKGFQQAGGQA